MIKEFNLDTYIFFKSFETDKMEEFLDKANPFYQELLFLEKLSGRSLVSCIVPKTFHYYNNFEKTGTSNLINLLNALSKKSHIKLHNDGNIELFYEALKLFRRKTFVQDYIIKIEYGSDIFKYLVRSKTEKNKGILYEPI